MHAPNNHHRLAADDQIEREHDRLVRDKCKPGEDILDSLTPEKVHAWHMASCIMGEAGELFDAVKKWVIYNSEIDTENVVEEFGDLEFYLKGLRQVMGLDRISSLQHNTAKLTKRYQGKYSDREAIDRADKASEIPTGFWHVTLSAATASTAPYYLMLKGVIEPHIRDYGIVEADSAEEACTKVATAYADGSARECFERCLQASPVDRDQIVDETSNKNMDHG